MPNDSNAGLPRSASRADVAPTDPSIRVPRDPQDPDDISEMLQELRVLIPGVQVLTGFLLILPFSQGFGSIALAE